MQHVLSTFFFLFIAFMSINAQSNFRPGYVIINETDTISGVIDFRTYKINAQLCRFRLSDTSEEKVYYPGDIYGYRFTDDGKYYVSKDIEIEGQQEKVFLEYLVQGIISLYFYPGEQSDYYFFQDNSGKMIPVTKQDKKDVKDKNKSMIGMTTSGIYNLEDNKYKGIVRYIFKDSESVSKAALKMSFKQNEIIDLTKKYHADVCTSGEECIVFTAKPDKYVKIKVSVYAGLQMQTYKTGSRSSFSPYIGYISTRPNISDLSSLSPMAGTQIDLSIPRWNKSISLLTDISFALFKDEQERISSGYERLEANGFVTSIKLGGKYTYLKGLFRPVVEGGFMLNNMFVPSQYYTGYKSIATDKIVITHQTDGLIKSNFMPGLHIGAGFNYQLQKDNALLFRIAYDGCRLFRYGDTMTAWQLKLGYAF